MSCWNGIKKTKTFEKYDTRRELAVKHAWYTHLMHNEWAGLIYRKKFVCTKVALREVMGAFVGV
jgi:hypothetical protein